MAISIEWGTSIITVPKTYLTLITGTLYELDTDQFKKDIAGFLDDEAGMPFPDAFVHNTEVTVAGITYARFIEIISPYSVTFEDGQYTVRLVGSNNNIFDVENGILNQNQVQVIPGNAAGLIVRESGVSGLTAEEAQELDELHKIHGLESGEDLVVTPDDRKVGDGAEISQTIVKVGDTVTVSRD